MDRRIVLAGEHASYLPAWQEGAVLSAHTAVEQLHRRALAAA
jgi:monoamine oxidase